MGDGARGAASGVRACPLALATPQPVATLDDVRRALPRDEAAEVGRSLGESGLGGHDVLRLWVAHEREPLTCIAAFRGYRYDDEERRGAERVARALRQRIALERRLRHAPLSDAGFTAAMEAIQAPAFLVRDGHAVHANALGRARLDARRDATLHVLAEVRAGRAPPGAEVTTVRCAGSPDHALVVLRGAPSDVEGRAALLAARWALTPRQREVLAHLARGGSNRDAAGTLGCAESTVELHVTAILRKAGVPSRARLVAAFWTSG